MPDSGAYLKTLAEQGLAARLKGQHGDHARYQARLAQELAIIDQLGFNDYFLIVWDIVNFAYQNHIQLGAGRFWLRGHWSRMPYALPTGSIAIWSPLERFLNADRPDARY